MNIVHLIFSLETGGSENLLVDIVNEQVERARVTLIVINNKVEKELVNRISSKVDVKMLNRNAGSKMNYVFLLKLWKFLLTIKPDVIHCHNENNIPLLPFFKTKAVVTVHDVGYPTANLPKYKKVFSISNSVADDLKKSSISSSIVSNGINFPVYNRRYNYSSGVNNKFRITQVSRLLHEKKGQDVLIKAVDILVHKYKLTNITVDFIGGGTSESYLQKLVKELGLKEYIHFCGNKDRNWVQQNLCAYHLLVQPSRYEGFGLTVIEAIAAGIPVIASDIEGPAEILQNVPAGFLFPTESEGKLADSIINVYNKYQQGEIEEFCEESRSIIEEKYSIRKTANEYLENYLLQ
jgi:glycosyltransferase involved in cell wall biosynthesis